MTAILQEVADDPRLAYRYTVDDYHRMIEDGTLDEGAPFELLDGQVVRKLRNAAGDDRMRVGDDHRIAVQLLGKRHPGLRNREPAGPRGRVLH